MRIILKQLSFLQKALAGSLPRMAGALLLAVSLSCSPKPKREAGGSPPGSATAGGGARDNVLSLKKEKTFYRNLGAEPENLHPVKSSDVYSSKAHDLVLESLLQRNARTYQWQAGLAEKWQKSPDGKSFTFFLRKGLKWSDGRPLTAEDIKFSLEAYKNPAYGGIHYAAYFENLEKAEVLSGGAIRFYVKKIYFKNFDIAAGMDIFPRHIYELPEEKSAKSAAAAKPSPGHSAGNAGASAKGKTGGAEGQTKSASAPSPANKLNLNKTVIGSGPYKISSYIKGKALHLSKNPFYSPPGLEDQNKWSFPHIVLRFISNSTDAILRLQKGDLDFIGLSAEAYEKQAIGPLWEDGLISKVKYSNKEPSGYGYIGLNLKKPLFQDKKTRRALAHLLNRKFINKHFYLNYAKPAAGPWYSWSEYADSAIQPIPFDPKKAGLLLKEAGWRDDDKNGVLEKTFQGAKKEFAFSILTAGGHGSRRILTFFQEDLRKAGIRLSIKQIDWTSFLSLLKKKTFDGAMLGWGAGSSEIDPKQIWHSTSARPGGSNFIGYSNAAADRLIDRARMELDRKKRILLLQEVYRLIAEDAPYIFLFNRPYKFYGAQKRIIRPEPFLNYSLGMEFWSLRPE